jgi:hypothetical protein
MSVRSVRGNPTTPPLPLYKSGDSSTSKYNAFNFLVTEEAGNPTIANPDYVQGVYIPYRDQVDIDKLRALITHFKEFIPQLNTQWFHYPIQFSLTFRVYTIIIRDEKYLSVIIQHIHEVGLRNTFPVRVYNTQKGLMKFFCCQCHRANKLFYKGSLLKINDLMLYLKTAAGQAIVPVATLLKDYLPDLTPQHDLYTTIVSLIICANGAAQEPGLLRIGSDFWPNRFVKDPPTPVLTDEQIQDIVDTYNLFSIPPKDDFDELMELAEGIPFELMRAARELVLNPEKMNEFFEDDDDPPVPRRPPPKKVPKAVVNVLGDAPPEPIPTPPKPS